MIHRQGAYDERPLQNWKTSHGASLGETRGPFCLLQTRHLGPGRNWTGNPVLPSRNWALGTTTPIHSLNTGSSKSHACAHLVSELCVWVNSLAFNREEEVRLLPLSHLPGFVPSVPWGPVHPLNEQSSVLTTVITSSCITVFHGYFSCNCNVIYRTALIHES